MRERPDLLDGVAEAIVDAGADLSMAEAQRYVVIWLMPYLVLGLLLALAAWFLPRRQPWARWIGLAANVVLALLTLFSAVTAGGVTIASLLLLVLSFKPSGLFGKKTIKKGKRKFPLIVAPKKCSGSST